MKSAAGRFTCRINSSLNLRGTTSTRGYVGDKPQFSFTDVSRHSLLGTRIRLRSRARRVQLRVRANLAALLGSSSCVALGAGVSELMPTGGRNLICFVARNAACCRSQARQKTSDWNHRVHFSAVHAFSMEKHPVDGLKLGREGDGKGSKGGETYWWGESWIQ